MISPPEMNRQACELYLHESLELCQYLEEGLLLLGNDPKLAQLPRLLRSIEIIAAGAEQLNFEDLCQLTDALKAILRALETLSEDQRLQYWDSFLGLLQPISEQLRFTLLLAGYQLLTEETAQNEQLDLIQQFLLPKSLVVLQEALQFPNLTLCRLLWKKQLLLLRIWSFSINSADIATLAETTLKTLDTFPEGMQVIGELAITALTLLSKTPPQQAPTTIQAPSNGMLVTERPVTEPLTSPKHFSTSERLLWITDGYLFYVASDSIAEIVVPQSRQIIQISTDSYLKWENQTIILYNASALILNRHLDSLEECNGPVLVLKQDQRYLALALEIEHLVTETTLSLTAAPVDAPAESAIVGWTRIKNILTPILDVNLRLQQHVDRNGPHFHSLEARPQQVTPSTPSPLILVVDDSKAIREQICGTLQSSGYRTLQAQGGQEALDCLQAHPGIGLVISDLEMGNLSGFEFLRKRLQNAEFKHIPVMILSSHTSAEYRQLAQKLGAVAYLSIPYEPQSLLSNISALLGAEKPS
jgi:CheY-like chemotaxis protein